MTYLEAIRIMELDAQIEELANITYELPPRLEIIIKNQIEFLKEQKIKITPIASERWW